MKTKIIFIFIFIFLINNFVAGFNLDKDILYSDNFNQIFDYFYVQGIQNKEIDLFYEINSNNELINNKTIYQDIIISNISLSPRINNSVKNLVIDTNIEPVYLLSIKKVPKNLASCFNTLQNHYLKLPFNTPYNLKNKETILSSILIPITKEKLISSLTQSNYTLSEAESCINDLINNKNLVPYPIILKLEARINNNYNFSKNQSFILDFVPEFNNEIKPLKFNVIIKKTPIKIKSQYSAAKDCDKQKLNSCYINYTDISDFRILSIKPDDEKSNFITNSMLNTINNFKIIKNFKYSKFENIDVTELLLNVLSSREEFCFRSENENYNKIIFDVAKAYGFSLEETFLFWAIISERSNCNLELNPSLKGFAQIDLQKISKEDTIALDPSLPKQLVVEEQYQYLALGDFSEINKYILEHEYKQDKSLFYNYGYKGKIANDNGYFGFLMNAIKKNRDSYGSTIYFASDFIKEINFIVKKSREQSNRPFIFDNFIYTNNENINYLFLLGLIQDKTTEEKEKIYSYGDYHDFLDADTNLFILAKNGNHTYVKTTKETRILINYLTIKKKYLKEKEYFEKIGINDLKTNSSDLKNIVNKYEKLDHNYWNTKKDLYLSKLKENNIKLNIKLEKYQTEGAIAKAYKGSENLCAAYIWNFGQKVYVDGVKRYKQGPNAWTFDTNPTAVNTYNLIWQAEDICKGKNKCSSETYSGTVDCCKEIASVKDKKYTNFPLEYYKYLPDGAVLGVEIPGSRHNNKNREFTHVIMYVGKTKTGEYLMTHNYVRTNLLKLRDYITGSRKIKSIYVPKETGIKSLNQLINLNKYMPATYVLNVDEKGIKFDPKYYEEVERLEPELEEQEVSEYLSSE